MLFIFEIAFSISPYSRNAFNEEKRRLETKLAQLEEELEDEHNVNEQFNEKMRKFQADIEKLTNDLQIEKANVAKSEVTTTHLLAKPTALLFQIFIKLMRVFFSFFVEEHEGNDRKAEQGGVGLGVRAV